MREGRNERERERCAKQKRGRGAEEEQVIPPVKTREKREGEKETRKVMGRAKKQDRANHRAGALMKPTL